MKQSKKGLIIRKMSQIKKERTKLYQQLNEDQQRAQAAATMNLKAYEDSRKALEVLQDLFSRYPDTDPSPAEGQGEKADPLS